MIKGSPIRTFFTIIWLLHWAAVLLAGTAYSTSAAQPPALLPQTPQQPQLPGQTAASQGAAARQLQALNRIRQLYDQLNEPDFSAFRSQYLDNYNFVDQMQQECNEADISFLHSYSADVADFLIETNLKIHAIMAIAAARLGYDMLYERHMEVALRRIRRHNAYRGQTAEAAFRDILQRAETQGDQLLEQEFCKWAVGGFCTPPPTETPFFQQYRESSGNPLEFEFDRSLNMVPLSEFAVAVLDPGNATPNSLLFASAFDNELRQPLVRNWFIRLWLDQYVQPAELKKPEPGIVQVFAQQNRINIEPIDFFIKDPTDLEKVQWIDHVQQSLTQKQILSLFRLMPDGEYYVYRRDQGIPPDAKPNLILDRTKGKVPIGFRFVMSQSGTRVNVEPMYRFESLWAKLLKPDFKILRFGAGFNSQSGLEFDSQVRAFHRFSKNFAFQTQLEFAYRKHHDSVDLDQLLPTFVSRADRLLDEGACEGLTETGSCLDDFGASEFQFDFGPVFRIKNFQFAVMESLRRVKRSEWDDAGTVGQYFFNVGYIFSRGQVGAYATRASKDRPIVKTVAFDEVFFEETYLKVANQFGVNFHINAFKNYSVEGAFGTIDSSLRDSTYGGTVRVNMPPFWKFKPYAEFGINESFVASDNSFRFGGGVLWGEWGKGSDPRTFVTDVDGPVPVYVPRVRYETLTRVIRAGNRPPVAVIAPCEPQDVGCTPPDMTVPPNTRVVVDGTPSFDPDGDDITFEWTKLDDCPREIVLENADGTGPVTADTEIVSFVIGAGQMCTIQLVVTDTFGAPSDPVTKKTTSLALPVPEIIRFAANPAEIRQGETSTLTWDTEGADFITITNSSDFISVSDAMGNNVPLADPLPVDGSAVTMPADTTTYVLTACNSANECATAEVTVLVRGLFPTIVEFIAVPSEVHIGEDGTGVTPACQANEAGSRLSWQTENATTVTLTNVTDGTPPATVNLNGSRKVCLTQTTTFTLTATNDRGEIVSADVTVNVLPDTPVIDFFTATPPRIREGETSKLEWSTRGASMVTISNLPGNPSLAGIGMAVVSPEETTTYTLTACNDRGDCVSASVTVEVLPPLPVIVSFVAEPSDIRIGDSSTLTWVTTNADGVTITNVPNPVQRSGSLIVLPTQTTTYTLTATNGASEFVTADVTITVRPLLPEIIEFTATPPEARIGDDPDCPAAAGTRLQWLTRNAATVTLTNPDGVPEPVPANSPAPGALACITQTTTFTLTVSNGAGEIVSAAVTVGVLPLRPPAPIIIDFSADPPTVGKGGTTTLKWQTQNAVRVSILNMRTGQFLPVDTTQGEFDVVLFEDGHFLLTAFSSDGQEATRNLDIHVF